MIFSDESTIAVLDDRVQSVRRRQGEEFKPECLKKTLKFPSKIMVWGAISVHGPSRLHIVEGTMNGAKYISMLNSRLLPQIRNWFEQEPCIFQQDSAPCHTAKAVYAWFKTNKIKVLKWPGNSPDMNPIESMWNQLKDEIHNHNHQSSTDREAYPGLVSLAKDQKDVPGPYQRNAETCRSPKKC